MSKEQMKTSIGGQAVIEGVMMRGPEKTAMAVRQPNGEIALELWAGSPPTAWYKSTPFIRGIFNFIDMMKLGYKCLMKSAELSGVDMEDEEPSKWEKKLNDLFGDKLMSVVTTAAMILGVGIAVMLFMALPTALSKGVNYLAGGVIPNMGLSFLEGGLKIIIFIIYLSMVRKMPEMKRMFSYHGAEHKTIACYEAKEELTIENVRKYTRFHPRCGTSFLLIVLIISILVFSVVTWQNGLIRVALKILLLPFVVGIAYEIIKLAGRYDNWATRVISAPGLCLQRLTTNEPDDSMIEVAIASIKPVIPTQEGADKW